MVAAAIVGSAVVGGAISASSASDAADSNNRATDAASVAAGDDLALQREKWDYQKNTYLPKAMQMADDQAALSKKLADNQLKDSELYRGLASDSFTQAKKSWKYQDQFMDMTDQYASGSMGNRMADEANADVEQAYGGGLKTMMRGAQRYGINPGSGEFAAQMGDMALQHAADSAGAQTNARVAARDKAEKMVAMAAGSGQAGFGTGLSAGALASGATAGAGAQGQGGLTALNGVAGTIGSPNFASPASSFSRLRYDGSNPMGDFLGGAATGAIKAGGLKMPSFNYGAGSNAPGMVDTNAGSGYGYEY